MDAGRELDAEVAEKVMHWTRRLVAGRFYWFGPYDGRTNPRMDCSGAAIGDEVALAFAEPSDHERWAPSTNIAAAWQVVARLCPRGRMEVTIYEDLSARVEVYLSKLPFQQATATAGEDTVPLAICRAALAAVATEVPA